MSNELLSNRLESIFLEKLQLQSEIDNLEIQCLCSRELKFTIQKLHRISELQNKLDKLEELETYSSNLSTQYDW